MNGEYLTEEKIAYMQKYLKKNPIDSKWDGACEMLDDRYPAFKERDDISLSQELARAYQLILKSSTVCQKTNKIVC